jgi:hypothetical protein
VCYAGCAYYFYSKKANMKKREKAKAINSKFCSLKPRVQKADNGS